MRMKIPKRSPLTAIGPSTATALEIAIAETRAWVDRAVIGLNLCPFAKAAQARGRTRFVCSAATDQEALLGAFCDEARWLVGASPADTETTLLIHPFVLADFDDYNDFLDLADTALEALGCSGVLQVASFHPRYRFAGTAADDVTNATNRSPHPVLQLLREDSIAAAVTAFPDSATIYEANLATLRRLGAEGWAELAESFRAWSRPVA